MQISSYKISFAVYNISNFTMYSRSPYQCPCVCIILYCLCY